MRVRLRVRAVMVAVAVTATVLGLGDVSSSGAGAQAPRCPGSVAGLSLDIEASDSADGLERLNCSYEPDTDVEASRVAFVATWVAPGADPADSGLCGSSDSEQEEDGRWYGFAYSESAAAQVWYEAEDAALGVNKQAVRKAALGLLTAVEAVAQRCDGTAEPTPAGALPTATAEPTVGPDPTPPVSAPPVTRAPAQGPTVIDGVELAVPPAEPTADELALYDRTLVCETALAGFDLETPGAVRVVGDDWLAFDCSYVRSGVDPGQATAADRAEVGLSWTKINGRNARHCIDENREFENDTVRTVYRYDTVHSAEVEIQHPVGDPAVASGFPEAGDRLLQRVAPFAYVCPNFREIVFDPIPPYWQPVLGTKPVPPPLVLPAEVTAADVVADPAFGASALDAVATTDDAVVASPGAPGDPGDPTQPVAPTGPDRVRESAARSALWRVLGIAAFVLSIAGLAIALLLVGRQNRVRPKWDYVRLAVAVLTIAVLTLVVGVTTPIAYAVIAAVVGAALGVLQGRNLEVRHTATGLYATRNIVAIAVFAAGLLTVQVASLANRSSLVALGLALSFLSAAMTAGLIVGRRPRIAQAGATTITFLLLGLVAVGSLAIPDSDDAEAQTSAEDPATAVLIDMVDWNEIRVVGGLWAGQGKPVRTISVPRGFAQAPEPVTNRVTWEHTIAGTVSIHDLTETYSFTLEDGSCCLVSIVADGSRTTGTGTPEQHHAEAMVRLRPVSQAIAGEVTPFADPELFTVGDSEEPLCGRSVADLSFGDHRWTAYTVDGADRNEPVELYLLTGCDLPDFTVANALALAPPPPGSEARMQDALGPCPVLQEIVAPIAQAAGLSSGATYTVGRLYTAPNTPVCDDGLGLGDFRPGGLQLTMLWSMATNDIETEVARRNEINQDFIGATRQFSIYDEEACPLDANGDVLPPAPGSDCFRRQFFSVGSEVTVWTEYSEDGPNVEVRGNFAWGSYYFRCHHCDPSDPLIRDAIGAWHAAGARASAASAAAPPPLAESGAESGADEPGAGGESVAGEDVAGAQGDLEDAAVEEGADADGEGAADAGDADDDIDAGQAAAAAGVALVGSAAMAGVALSESDVRPRKIRDALRGNLPRFGDEPPVEVGPLPEPPGGLHKSERVREALRDLPPHVAQQIEDAVTVALNEQTRAQVAARARAAVGEVDRSVEDIRAAVRSTPEIDRILHDLPEAERSQVESALVRDIERQRIEQAVAGAREAMARQRASELVAQALDRGDARGIDQIMGELPEEARDGVWARATAGRAPVDLEAMRAGQPPDTDPRPVVDLLPTRPIHEVIRTPELDEPLSDLPHHVRVQVEQEVRTRVESEVREAARARARAAVGEIDPTLEDMSEMLRRRPDAIDALDRLPEYVRRDVTTELVRDLERERLDGAVAATRAALERQRAIALVRESLAAGDVERANRVMELLPDDARAPVWEAGAAGVDLRGGPPAPDARMPIPQSLLPEAGEDVDLVIVESPPANEVLRELPSHVRARVEAQVREELETELVDAAVRRVQDRLGPLDPSADSLARQITEDPALDDALRPLPAHLRDRVETQVIARAEQARVAGATHAAQHAAELDRAENAVRRAVESGDAARVQAILQGLDPDDAQAISEIIAAELPK